MPIRFVIDKNVGFFFLVQFLFSFGTAKLEFWTQSKQKSLRSAKKYFFKSCFRFCFIIISPVLTSFRYPRRVCKKYSRDFNRDQ